MQQMGFPDAWIRGVSALYRSAHSRVLLAGDRGERFSISRSVKQGCPLAPSLFLFFAEAMSSFLRDQDALERSLPPSEGRGPFGCGICR